MKIKKNNTVVEFKEREIKEIVKKFKINKFLTETTDPTIRVRKNGDIINLSENEIKKMVNYISEDRKGRKYEDKKDVVNSILKKLTTLSRMLDSTKYNLESLSTLNKIQEFLEKQIEDFEDKIDAAAQKSKEEN